LCSNRTETKKQRLGAHKKAATFFAFAANLVVSDLFKRMLIVEATEGRDSEYVPLSPRRSHGEGNLRRAVRRSQSRGGSVEPATDEGDGERIGG